MPWTFSHPAAVLPLRRIGPWRLPLSGLVAGSIAPDLGYYIGRTDWAAYAHTLPGIVVLCVPGGWLCVVLMRWLREPLVALLPQPHRGALRSLPRPAALASVRELPLLCAALVLGALTHVLWDAFTHGTGFMVQQLPALQTALFEADGRTIHVFHLLQHLSTLVGLACLLVAYRRWLGRNAALSDRRADASEALRQRLVLGLALAAVLIGLLLALLALPAPDDLHYASASGAVVRTVIYSTNAFVLMMLVAALAWTRRRTTE